MSLVTGGLVCFRGYSYAYPWWVGWWVGFPVGCGMPLAPSPGCWVERWLPFRFGVLGVGVILLCLLVSLGGKVNVTGSCSQDYMSCSLG